MHGRERVRGTLGRHRAPRALRPHPHLEPRAARTSPARVRRALQHPPAPPGARPTRTQQRGSRRVPARPADPTTLHLQRTHQRVRPSSLNDSDNGNPHKHINFDAPDAHGKPRLGTGAVHRATEQVFGTHTVQVLEAGRATTIDGSRPVFCRADGARIHPQVVSDAFKRLVARWELRRIRFHDLRRDPRSVYRFHPVEHPVERAVDAKWPWSETGSDQGQHGGGDGT